MSGYATPTTYKSSSYVNLLRFCGTDSTTNDPRDLEAKSRVKRTLNDVENIPEDIRPLLPLVYRNSVKAHIFDQLNPPARSFIKLNTMRLVGIELAKNQWLQKAIQSFVAADIPLIILKGAAFSGYLYSDDAPRPGIDVDILVRSADFSKACDVLTTTMEPIVISDKRLATHHSLFERVFVPKEGFGPTAELHRALTNPYIFSIEEAKLWDSSERHPKYKNEKVRVLSPENTLLHLAVHAFRDMDFCSHNLLDAHQLINLRGLNETQLYQMGTDWGATAVLYYLLANVREIMGGKVQSQFLKKLAPSTIKRRIQESLLGSVMSNYDSKPICYRATQLASQLVFPDKLTGAVRFQMHYATTRMTDVVFS